MSENIPAIVYKMLDGLIIEFGSRKDASAVPIKWALETIKEKLMEWEESQTLHEIHMTKEIENNMQSNKSIQEQEEPNIKEMLQYIKNAVMQQNMSIDADTERIYEMMQYRFDKLEKQLERLEDIVNQTNIYCGRDLLKKLDELEKKLEKNNGD